MQNIAPLAVVAETAVCDGCGIEARITTDGHLAVAETLGGGALTVGRSGTIVRAECPMVRSNVPCHGGFEWDLAAGAGTWRAATNMDRDLLNQFGDAVER